VTAGLPIHPAADLFPMLPASELQALADDIRVNGQREPVVLWDGQVLDGRNRLAACDLAGVEPLTRTLDVCPDPLAYVLSTNLIRRHLTESQRAMVAAKVRPMLAEQAKARMLAGVRTDDPTPNWGEGAAKGESADQAADMLNVGRGSVERAAKVLRHGTPELVDAVERGDVAVSAAAAVASLPAEDQRDAVAGGAVAIREKAKAIREAKPKRSPAPPPSPPAAPAFPALASTVPTQHRLFDESHAFNALLVNAGPWLDGRAKKVMLSGTPELVAAVGSGEVTVRTAADLVSLPADRQRALLARGPDAVGSAAKEIRELRRKRKARRPEAAPVQLVIVGLPEVDALRAEVEQLRVEVERLRAATQDTSRTYRPAFKVIQGSKP